MMHDQAAARSVVCDGCGQGTTSEHIARRLERLEQTTRYRPVHIQAVFLSAQSPSNSGEFLYSGQGGFQGEAGALLSALQIGTTGREPEATLSEFQRKGFLLTHVLECASETGAAKADLTESLRAKLPSVLRRLRVSLKPKKVYVISPEMAAVCGELAKAQIGAELMLDGASPYDLSDAHSVNRLRTAL